MNRQEILDALLNALCLDSLSVCQLDYADGKFFDFASFAALRRRAPATTSYLLSSSSRTRRGAKIHFLPACLMLTSSGPPG
jgi:hypothetical protein